MITSVPRSLSFDLGALVGNGIVWTSWREGIDIFRLYGDGRIGPAAALLRYAPHAEVPLHEHEGHEHIFVLSGFQEDDAGVYRAGTMIVNPPGSQHRVRAPEGCTVLVLWERPIVFIEALVEAR